MTGDRRPKVNKKEDFRLEILCSRPNTPNLEPIVHRRTGSVTDVYRRAIKNFLYLCGTRHMKITSIIGKLIFDFVFNSTSIYGVRGALNAPLFYHKP